MDFYCIPGLNFNFYYFYTLSFIIFFFHFIDTHTFAPLIKSWNNYQLCILCINRFKLRIFVK